jgi:hypothetical protein
MRAPEHYHRCGNPVCSVSWICYASNCDSKELCDACERRRFETWMEQRGLTVSQPVLPELEESR